MLGQTEQNLKLKVNKNPPIPITQYQPVNNYRPIPKTMSSMPNMLSTSQSITIPYRPEVPNPGPPPQKIITLSIRRMV